MWDDYWLLFDCEASYLEQLALVESQEGLALDVVGNLSTPEVKDAEGNVIQEAFNSPGFHVNMRCKGEPPEELAPFCIPEPQHKKRVWL